MSAKFHDEKGNEIPGQELEHKSEDYLASAIVRELGNLLNARAADLPHRFRAPKALAKYLADYGVNQSYQQFIQITSNQSDMLLIQFTTRPTQGILELIFQSSDGFRLFTLEIEYAVQEKG